MKNEKMAFPGRRVVGESVRYDEAAGENVRVKITEEAPGMTLREYYAGLAMANLAVSPHFVAEKNEVRGLSVARNAVQYADALIAELEK